MNRGTSLVQILIVSVAVISISLLYFFFPPSRYSFYPSCPFHALTNLYCPGCGSQRALSHLLHGHLWNAASSNLLLVLTTPFLLYSAFVFVWNTFSNKPGMKQRFFHSPVFVKLLLVLVLVFAILRNIDAYPFSWLAP
ncbi:MAG: DUF2752 domain-containing protein [Chitinophagaceae bacterium]|nr:DUF2752 domain-containing protein [Chitinophagaceae bacterium]